MDYNASLDDIIKKNKSKIGLKSRNKNWKNKNAKPAVRTNNKKKQTPPPAFKQNQPAFKAKLKKRKIVDVPDARMKIIQNKKKLRRRSVENMRSPLLKDARLKIEARRQKQRTPPPLPLRSNLVSRGSAVTSLAPNGIIHRRINPNLARDNGIRVEYEDEEMMSLENEPITRSNWSDKFTIRRTISNPLERKRFPPTLMGYRDLDAEPEEREYFERDSVPFNELTRTITNIKASPSLRKNYSSRLSSPVRQRSSPMRQSPIDDMRIPPPSKSSYSAREANYSSRDNNYSSRDNNYPPRDRDNNYPSRDSNYPPRDSNYSSRESSYPSRDSNYSSRESSYPSRDSNYPSRDSNYSSRDSNYLSRDTGYQSRESTYYRIMISNLHEKVTTEDIKELFEDIGDLVYTRMTRNGTAEVAYKHEKDAENAVEIYHNRQLDGLPMKCTLISNTSESTNLKKRHSRLPPVSTKSSIEPDTSLIKKALFN